MNTITSAQTQAATSGAFQCRVEGAVCPGTGTEWGTLCVEISNTVIKPTKGWSAFYYHHVPTILNTANDKVLLPEKVFCWPNFETTTMVVSKLPLSFNNVCVSFKLAQFNNLTVSKHCILHGSYSEGSQLFSGSPTHTQLATQVPFENELGTV